MPSYLTLCTQQASKLYTLLFKSGHFLRDAMGFLSQVTNVMQFT